MDVEQSLPGIAAGAGPVLGIGRIVSEALVLDQPPQRVHPEAVHPALEPEAQHLEHRRLDLEVPPVQVRLLLQEGVEIVLLCLLIPGPGAPAEG